MPPVPTLTLNMDPAGSNTQKTVSAAKIIQEEQAHDLAVITVRGEDPTQPEFHTGTPLHVQYGWSGIQMEDFFGYVNHITPPYERTYRNRQGVYMDIFCVGCSYVLKGGISRIWRGSAASQALIDVASSNYFSVLVETDDYSWDQLTCPGISAWQFLRGLADRLGWFMACNKTEFRFMSYDLALNYNATVMPTFFARNTGESLRWETLNRFDVLQGETVPLEGARKANRILGGIDVRTGKVWKVNNDSTHQTIIGVDTEPPLFNHYETGLVADNQGFAQQRLVAETARNRFYIRAKANVSGDVTVKQGIPVVFMGISTDSDGAWWVRKATHNFGWQSYTMDLELGRDSVGDSGARSRHSPIVIWSKNDPFALSGNITPPPTVMVNGRWRAAYQANLGVRSA